MDGFDVYKKSEVNIVSHSVKLISTAIFWSLLRFRNTCILNIIQTSMTSYLSPKMIAQSWCILDLIVSLFRCVAGHIRSVTVQIFLTPTFLLAYLRNRDTDIALLDEGNGSMKLLHKSDLNGRKTSFYYLLFFKIYFKRQQFSPSFKRACIKTNSDGSQQLQTRVEYSWLRWYLPLPGIFSGRLQKHEYYLLGSGPQFQTESFSQVDQDGWFVSGDAFKS